jgi:hypothetical protein
VSSPSAAPSGRAQHPDSTSQTSDGARCQTHGSVVFGRKTGTGKKENSFVSRSLSGRDDVYACRGESAAGRSGYSPAAQKDWKAISRSRPQDRKKVDQKTRKYFPLTDSVIENHLLGKETSTNRALMSEIQSIWVDFERKADSPNC